MSQVIDFDAFRREREASDEAPDLIFRIGGKDYALPPRPPASVVLDIVRLKREKGEDGEASLEALVKMGEAIFGEADFQEIIRANRLGPEDMGEVITQTLARWGAADEGEARPNRRTRRAKPST